MHKNRFLERNRNLGIPTHETERMWRVLQEKQMMEQMMQAASVAGSGSTPTTQEVHTLTITLDDIANASLLVANPSSVGDWNSWFDLPGVLGQAFTSVELSGNDVLLKGGSGIKIKPDLVYGSPGITHIVAILDTGCVIGVGGGAFADCTNLNVISLPACTVIYGREESLMEYGAFQSTLLGSTFSMPSLITVGNGAFYTSGLNDATMPVVETIGNQSFYTCPNLAIISAPLCTSIGTGSFSGCTNLNIGNLGLVTSIGGQAFRGCSAITTADFPQLLSISTETFYQCSSMTTFTAPNLAIAGPGAFASTSLTSISFPHLPETPPDLFSNCPNLSSISLPAVTVLGDYTFYGCSSLSGIITLNSVEQVGMGCFQDCQNIGGCILINATSIGAYAFENAYYLGVLVIPNCLDLGGSPGNNGVFNGLTTPYAPPGGLEPEVMIRSITIPEYLMNANGKDIPDGDITFLEGASNPLNITIA